MRKHAVGQAGAQEVDPLRGAFESHYEPLLRLARLLTRREQDAEDLVQEAFVRAAPRLAQMSSGDTGPYLRRAVINLWKNRLRRWAVEVRARVASRPGHVQPHEVSDAWNAVRRLPPRQRACVVLRFGEDLTERDVAQVLGCSIGTVKSQTSRALAKLRKELGDAD